MSRRSIAVRIVLVMAALATVATSAPDDVLLSDTVSGTLGIEPTAISISANRSAVNHASFVAVAFTMDGVTASFRNIDQPDDPAVPFELQDLSVTIELGYDLDALCTRDRDCETGITVKVPTAPVHVSVTASFGAEGDGALLFPDDNAFPGDAKIEVRFGP